MDVQAGSDGAPRAVAPRSGRRRGPLCDVERIDEVWRIVDEWWRASPIARTYYRLALTDGRALTLFHNDVGGGAGSEWFQQRY